VSALVSAIKNKKS